MTLIIENVKEEFLLAFKGLAKGINAKVKTKKSKKEPSEMLKEVMREVKEGKVERFKDFQSYKKAMDS